MDETTVHVIYALKMGPKYEKRYLRHFRNPDILRFDMQHEAWIFQKEWTQPILDAIWKVHFDESLHRDGRLYREQTIAFGGEICDYWAGGDQTKNRL